MPEKPKDAEPELDGRRLLKYLLIAALLILITVAIDIVVGSAYYRTDDLSKQIWTLMLLLDAAVWIGSGLVSAEGERVRATSGSEQDESRWRTDTSYPHPAGTIVLILVGAFFLASCFAINMA